MKVLHTGTIEAKAGGVATCVYFMLKGLRLQGCDAELFAYKPESNGKLVGEEVPVHYTRQPIKNHWNKLNYSKKYKKDLLALGKYDIYHANGIWLYDTYAFIDIARKQKKPYIIMPHGMLYPQDIVKSNRKLKNLSLKIRLLDDLNKAACVQTTCEEEMKHCRNLGIISLIAVIPNPIEIKEYKQEKKQKNKFCLGYIGRLSPRKNVEGLIYAWADLKKKCQIDNIYQNKFNESKLLIIGGGDNEYENFLKNEVKRLKLYNVEFTGFLSGEEKEKALTFVSVLAMPSEFENFGMVIAEGLIRGIPCIATHGSPWEELNITNSGWWIPYNQQELNKTVFNAFNTNDSELCKMGQNGIELMKKNYSLESTSKKMIQMYNWIDKKEEKPNFIYTL